MIRNTFFACIALAVSAASASAQQQVGGIAPEPGVAANAWASGGGPLKGRVVGPDGSPFAGARVVWMVSPTDTGAARTTPAKIVGEVKTGPDGRFVFPNAAKLAAKGVAHIVAFTPKGIAATKDGQVRPGPELVLPLPLQTRLNMVFQKQDGKPAAGVPITLVLMIPASRQSWPCPVNDGKPMITGP
ncbi:MAG: carboxypeptidase-like regulatory domain-containing protein, partial [Armatimonadota bacterium]